MKTLPSHKNGTAAATTSVAAAVATAHDKRSRSDLQWEGARASSFLTLALLRGKRAREESEKFGALVLLCRSHSARTSPRKQGSRLLRIVMSGGEGSGRWPRLMVSTGQDSRGQSVHPQKADTVAPARDSKIPTSRSTLARRTTQLERKQTPLQQQHHHHHQYKESSSQS